MEKQRKHRTPLEWEKEDSGQVEHPHREVKIVGEQKIGLETIDPELDDQENSSQKETAHKKK